MQKFPMWKQFARDYFDYTAKERTGIIVIAAIILILIFLPLFYPLFLEQEKFSHNEFDNEIAQLRIEKNDTSKFYVNNFNNNPYDGYSANEERKYRQEKAEVFYFDPNTTSAADWKKLGLRDKTIHTIQNYLAKGGKFYKPDDISKIWGLSPSDARRLIPYVSIKKNDTQYDSPRGKEYLKEKPSYAGKSIEPIDINHADTSQLISLPGIGSKLSNRIIAFREKLGGFYSVDQVAETYLLPDSTFQKIKVRLVLNKSKVKQININEASVDEMKSHPYLRYNLANAIFQYRQQHGNFNSVEEIKKIMLVTEETFRKVAPYLSVQ